MNNSSSNVVKQAPIAMTGGEVDVTMRITWQDIEESQACLQKIMEENPSKRPQEWYTKGQTEEELRLLFAAFWAAAKRLPLGPFERIAWLEMLGGSEALEHYSSWRTRQMDDNDLFDHVLCGRDLGALNVMAEDFRRQEAELKAAREARKEKQHARNEARKAERQLAKAA